MRAALDGPPPPRSWAQRHPEAAARWDAARPAANDLAESLGLPPENLVSPDVLRRLCWEFAVPSDADRENLTGLLHAELAARGARPWQADHLAPVLADALTSSPGAGDPDVIDGPADTVHDPGSSAVEQDTGD